MVKLAPAAEFEDMANYPDRQDLLLLYIESKGKFCRYISHLVDNPDHLYLDPILKEVLDFIIESEDPELALHFAIQFRIRSEWNTGLDSVIMKFKDKNDFMFRYWKDHLFF